MGLRCSQIGSGALLCWEPVWWLAAAAFLAFLVNSKAAAEPVPVVRLKIPGLLKLSLCTSSSEISPARIDPALVQREGGEEEGAHEEIGERQAWNCELAEIPAQEQVNDNHRPNFT